MASEGGREGGVQVSEGGNLDLFFFPAGGQHPASRCPGWRLKREGGREGGRVRVHPRRLHKYAGKERREEEGREEGRKGGQAHT